MSDDIRWICSYVLSEDSGGLGTVCIYEATSSRGDSRPRRSSRPGGRRDHPRRRHRDRAARSGRRRRLGARTCRPGERDERPKVVSTAACFAALPGRPSRSAAATWPAGLSVRSRRVSDALNGACPAGGTGRHALARHRPRAGPADGARAAPVADRDAARGATGVEPEQRADVFYVVALAWVRLVPTPTTRRNGGATTRRSRSRSTTTGATWGLQAARYAIGELGAGKPLAGADASAPRSGRRRREVDGAATRHHRAARGALRIARAARRPPTSCCRPGELGRAASRAASSIDEIAQSVRLSRSATSPPSTSASASSTRSPRRAVMRARCSTRRSSMPTASARRCSDVGDVGTWAAVLDTEPGSG